jgi:hypothetical protein
MEAACFEECRPAGICCKSFLTACFSGGFTGRINSPSSPKSKTLSGPPRSNPSRRHQSKGKTVWRFSVKVIVVAFTVIIYYAKPAFVNVAGDI